MHPMSNPMKSQPRGRLARVEKVVPSESLRFGSKVASKWFDLTTAIGPHASPAAESTVRRSRNQHEAWLGRHATSMNR